MGAVNLDTYAGDDLAISLECLQSDGTAFDLTGYTVVVKASWNEGRDEIELGSADLTIVPLAGTIAGEFTGEQTDDMPAGRETKLLLLLTDADGKRTTIRIGRIKVTAA